MFVIFYKLKQKRCLSVENTQIYAFLRVRLNTSNFRSFGSFRADCGCYHSSTLNEIWVTHSLVLPIKVVIDFVILIQLRITDRLLGNYALSMPFGLEISPHHEELDILDHFAVIKVHLIEAILNIEHLCITKDWISFELFFLLQIYFTSLRFELFEPIVDVVCNFVHSLFKAGLPSSLFWHLYRLI